MQEIVDQIQEYLSEYKEKLMAISSEAAHQTVAQGEWSRQEILGHLIDSAYNNHQWVMRTAMGQGLTCQPYPQEEWVKFQCYNEGDWFTMIDLWVQANLHFCNAVQHVPESALENMCNLGKEQPVPLKDIITKYPTHLKMHLDDILKP